MYFCLFLSISNRVRQGGILSPKLFSVYIDDLSDKLVKCKVGCYINNLCMNHIMYADDICLMAPSPAALQELIDICYDFSVQMIYLLILPNRIVWYLNLNRISCHVQDYIWTTNLLKYTDDNKYLGFTFISDQNDDKDLLQQLRLLYTKSNRLLRLFYHCSTDVKIALFRNHCNCFYCPFLWTHYKKSTHSKLRVAFNNVYRRILKLPPQSNASTMYMYAINNIDSFEVLIRNRIYLVLQSD